MKDDQQLQPYNSERLFPVISTQVQTDGKIAVEQTNCFSQVVFRISHYHPLERPKLIDIKDTPSPHDEGKIASERTARLTVHPNLTNRHANVCHAFRTSF
jgi:hypothetical protein